MVKRTTITINDKRNIKHKYLYGDNLNKLYCIHIINGERPAYEGILIRKRKRYKDEVGTEDRISKIR